MLQYFSYFSYESWMRQISLSKQHLFLVLNLAYFPEGIVPLKFLGSSFTPKTWKSGTTTEVQLFELKLCTFKFQGKQ